MFARAGAAQRKQERRAAGLGTHADGSECVFDGLSGLFPCPVFGIAVPLVEIEWHLVAELRSEKDQQGHGSECKERKVTGLFPFSTGLKESCEPGRNILLGRLRNG